MQMATAVRYVRPMVRFPVFQLTRNVSDRVDNSVDFSNIQKAFRSKSTAELLRHYSVYKLFSYNTLVNHSTALLHLAPKIIGNRLFEWLMKRTVYNQFVGGEDLKSLRPTVAKLSEAGIHSILDYAVEEDISDKESIVMEMRMKSGKSSVNRSKEEYDYYPQLKPTQSVGLAAQTSTGRTYFYTGDDRCEQNKSNFISCIETAAQVTENGQPFAAIKLTGLGRVEFLLRLSEVVLDFERIFLELSGSNDLLTGLIDCQSLHLGLNKLGVRLTLRETDELFVEIDSDKSGQISFFEWFNNFQPGRNLHQLLSARKVRGLRQVLAVLNVEEATQMKAVVQRARELADCALEKRVRLMVDAEQTYFQPAIRHIVVNILMPQYNLGAKPVVYNTVQAYLKNAEATLRMDLALAKRSGFTYGCKLVRGAYMDQEKGKAKQEKYSDPVWPLKRDTDLCYNTLMRLLINEVKGGNAYVMVASHNRDTIQAAIDCMRDAGIEESSTSVVFGQLLGMSDHISYPLGAAGYQAYKYIPYGPVTEVLPYLARRANENRGIMDTAKDERAIVKKELLRRIFSR